MFRLKNCSYCLCAHCSPPLQTLLAPAGSVYQKLAEECVKFGVGVELFLFPGTYCDVATLAKMASTTGGELHYYKNYQVRLPNIPTLSPHYPHWLVVVGTNYWTISYHL